MHAIPEVTISLAKRTALLLLSSFFFEIFAISSLLIIVLVDGLE